MSSQAYGKRHCGDWTGQHSYWLIGPRDFGACTTTSQSDPSCTYFELPPGYTALENDKYGITAREVVEGSINTWIAHGRRNGAPVPEASTDVVDQFIQRDVRSPGVFRIPICDMLEARENWYRAYRGAKPWKNFPCNE